MRISFVGLEMLALVCSASGSESNPGAAPASRHYSLPATPENVGH